MTCLHWMAGLVLVAVIGCGGKAVIDGEPGEGGGGAAASRSSNVGGSGGGALRVELVSATVSAACGPTPAGEVDIDMVLTLDNSIGTGTAAFVFVDGELLGADGSTLPFPITSEPKVSVPGGASMDVEFASMNRGVPAACNYCVDTTLQLTMHFDVDGGQMSLTRPVSSISCTMF